MDFISLVLMGMIVGYVASKLWKKKKMSLVGYLIVGAIGSSVGGFIFEIIGVEVGGTVGSYIISVVGAIVVLVVFTEVTHK